jgi:dephospho-CoA kinase
MMVVGVTGGIGSGKSLVGSVFNSLGIPLFNSDQEGRRLLSEDEKVKHQVVALLGEKVIDAEGKLDRSKIAASVFNNPAQLEALNKIIHPSVQQSFMEWVKLHAEVPYVIKETAILFESGTYKSCDKIITVIAPLDVRIQRVIERDGISREQVAERIKNQWSDEERIKHSDFLIYNDGNRLIIPQVVEIHKQLLSQVR